MKPPKQHCVLCRQARAPAEFEYKGLKSELCLSCQAKRGNVSGRSFSDWDAFWNEKARLSREGLPHGNLCPLHLLDRRDCCPEMTEPVPAKPRPDQPTLIQCVECRGSFLPIAFRNASGKEFPWCLTCRRKKTGKRPSPPSSMPDKVFHQEGHT